MRIVYIGAIEFSTHCLEAVLANGGNVVAVFTLPPETGKQRHSDYAPVPWPRSVHWADNINDHADTIWDFAPDVIFCFGWSGLLSPEVLAIPRLGCIGSHPTLLPRNRGHHPLIWAIALGLKETGLSFFRMAERVDAGPLISQERIPLGAEEDARSLYDKVKASASRQISDFLPRMIAGEMPLVAQDHGVEPNIWRKRGPADGRIDFRMSSAAICRLVRALTRPYPGATVRYKGKEYRVWSCVEANFFYGDENLEPGKVGFSVDGWMYIKTGDGSVRFVEHELPTMKSGDYIM